MLSINRLFFVFLLMLTFTSCVTDTEINTPALQAAKNDALFKTDLHKAILNTDGSLTITGSSLSEAINITIESNASGSYNLGSSVTNIATFLDNSQNFYTTGTNGEGVIEVTDISDNTISGNFRFRALKNGSEDPINFQKGWFYRLPIENASEPDNNRPCELSSITAMIDSHSLTTDTNIAQNLGNFLLVKGTTPEEEITIFFPINIETGDYPLSTSGNYSATYEVNNDRASAVSGTLSITYHDKENRCITGDFNYVTTTSVNVKNGHFEIGY